MCDLQETQLPRERVTPHPDHVFDHVGIDYAGPILLKVGHVRKPTLIKSYVCVFVSLTVKAVHLEAVSDLTTEAFISTLKRFVARRGLPSVIYSDNGSNFVGANNDIKQLYTSRWFSFLNEVSRGLKKNRHPSDPLQGLNQWRLTLAAIAN